VSSSESVLTLEYRKKTRRSEKLFNRAQKALAGGVSHNTRYYDPYPLFVQRARGKYLWDEDGNRLTDYWMGHTALILGHSPKVVVYALGAQLSNGTIFGMGSSASVELAEGVQRSVPCAEMVRFCNTGAEATMYLVRLARAYTRKRIVVKISGGWHGYNTQLNKEVHVSRGEPESAGILQEEQSKVLSIPFNDFDAAERVLSQNRNEVAVILLEPILGAGGCIPAEKEYLKSLRELSYTHGAILAFDEIITGFRLALGGAQEFYGVKPDLATFGKIIGGGLPIGLVCGQKEIVSLADPRLKDRSRFVSIGGGTFSENPLTMAAGLATLRYLEGNRNLVYRKLSGLGGRVRRELDRAFDEERVAAHTTGEGSLFMTHFTKLVPRNAQDAAMSDAARQHEYGLGLMANNIFLLPGHAGAISTVHTSEDIGVLADTTKRIAKTIASQRKTNK
jgi:glutamate-1-semialdehyde 2,1-aminomutase